jgi:hypothetical protein
MSSITSALVIAFFSFPMLVLSVRLYISFGSPQVGPHSTPPVSSFINLRSSVAILYISDEKMYQKRMAIEQRIPDTRMIA